MAFDDLKFGGASANWNLASTGTITWSTRAIISSPADGVVLMTNNAGTSFTRLDFGGTTSSFPALSRNSAGLEVKLADGSAFTTLKASTLTTSDTSDASITSAGGVTTLATGKLVWGAQGSLSSSSDGNFVFLNNAGSQKGGLSLNTISIFNGANQVGAVGNGSNSSVSISSNSMVGWSNSTTSLASIDTSLVRVSAGLIRAANGSTGLAQLARAMPRSLQTSTYTVTVSDSDGIIMDATDNALITLPAASTLAGMCITVMNTAANGAALISIDPNAADAIVGTVAAVSASGTANKDWRNTKATAKKGDYTTLVSDGTNTWYIIGGVGVWASEP